MPDTREKSCYFNAAEIFRGLTDDEITSIDRMMRVTTYRKGQLLYSPEESKEILFFIKKGTVQLYRLSSEGKKLVIATLGPDTLFGEMALIGRRMYDSFAEAREDVTLCIMSREDVLSLLLMKPIIALNLLEILGRRFLEIETALEDLAFKNVRTRLASLLLRLAEERKDNEIRGVRHQDLAEQLATLRGTVSEMLAEYKAEGLVELGWRRIIILNKQGLRHIAEG